MMARIRKSYIVAAAIALIAILTVICIHYHRTGRIIPFISYRKDWSIGIYIGKSPLKVSATERALRQVLSASDIKDVNAAYVADPFLIHYQQKWYMFFEIMNHDTGKGEIGYAVSRYGIKWKYQGIALRDRFHLAFPYVFEWQGNIYMLPDGSYARALRLYRAVHFPDKWKLVKKLMTGYRCVDPSMFYYNNRWWLFTSRARKHAYLFYSDSPLGPWQEHPQSPIVKDNLHIARSAGRIIMYNGVPLRFGQDAAPVYATKVRAFRITKLTPTEYREVPIEDNPILQGSGTGWNAAGMHTIDAHQLDKDKWMVAVDGFSRTRHRGWKY